MVLHSRRDVLGLGSAAATTALAGCTTLPLVPRPKLALTVMNHTEERYWLGVDLLRVDRNEADEARVFGGEYELAGGNGADSQLTEVDIVPSRRYLVRAEAYTPDGGRGQLSDHYHFYPDCSGTNEPSDRIIVQVGVGTNEEPRLRFDSSRCSPDSIYL